MVSKFFRGEFFKWSLLLGGLALAGSDVHAQNPLIRDQYSADPSVRVFGDTVYIFPSHDILAAKGKGRIGWFCMEDYHVFSSFNLTNWNDLGIIVQQNSVPWVKPNSYSMWAPDCIYRNGKYYFYFPSTPKDTTVNGNGFAIGVAIADKPEGPYRVQSQPILGVRGIDPNVFIDKDGQAYLYWSQGNIYGARLKENMLELASSPQVINALPEKGLKEGPYVFERNGLYYMTYPHVAAKIERLEYAIGAQPLGPFNVKGVIMDESPTGCWTNHHSIINFKGQWYLFYHHNDYSPDFDKARSIRADSLHFNPDGTIQKVLPSFRGIGITRADSTIQVDRYSAQSKTGVTVDFIDTTDRFKGWKLIFDKPGAWAQYNSVDFGNAPLSSVTMKAFCSRSGVIQIRLDELDGPLLAEVNIAPANGWQIVTTGLSGYKQGIHHLVLVMKDGRDKVELDWIHFK